MTCMSTNILGIFCITVILYDLLKGDWIYLPYHAIICVVFLTFFYGSCLLLGDTISLAILLIPAVVILISGASIVIMGTQGCYVKCKQTKPDVCKPPKLTATPSPTCPTITPAPTYACPVTKCPEPVTKCPEPITKSTLVTCPGPGVAAAGPLAKC